MVMMSASLCVVMLDYQCLLTCTHTHTHIGMLKTEDKKMQNKKYLEKLHVWKYWEMCQAQCVWKVRILGSSIVIQGSKKHYSQVSAKA